MEAVLRVKEAPWRVGLHTQESVPEAGGLSTVSSGASLWYMGKALKNLLLWSHDAQGVTLLVLFRHVD